MAGTSDGPVFFVNGQAFYPDGAHLATYHPYWTRNADGQKVRNPAFDIFSGLVLDLKDNRPNGINRFLQFLDPNLAREIAIAVVPSHDPNRTAPQGVRTLAVRLAENGRIDATGCLVRFVAIDKLATGGSRSIDVHLNSIRVEQPQTIHGRRVLVIDDVTTSGNSLRACERLLLQAGAAAVQRLAIGKTA